MTSESLTLSASLFHADVDSWLPADFGISKPESSKQKDWETALRTSRGERLGVGHADLADPTARARAASQRAGIELLNRKLQKRKEDNEKFIPRDEEEEEPESRGKKSKKRKRVDPFAKGEVKVHPLLNLKNPIPGYDAPLEKEGNVGLKAEEGKIELPSPQAEKIEPPKSPKMELKIVEKSAAVEPASPVKIPSDLSKTQLRHLKRKQQKAKQRANSSGSGHKLKATSKL